jgi:hypothetical protein
MLSKYINAFWGGLMMFKTNPKKIGDFTIIHMLKVLD